jgi:hypothetical protein
MKKIIWVFILHCSLFTVHCLSQPAPQNWNWYFGDSCAINFSTGTPVAVVGCVMHQQEGCATISNVSGNLLFYTDGVSVWNKNNVVMQHGIGLHGSWTTTQSALIVPKPDSSNIYYLFTCDEGGGGSWNKLF